jgi:hypothetical protein
MSDFKFIDDPFNEFRPRLALPQAPTIDKGNHHSRPRQLALSPKRLPARGTWRSGAGTFVSR